MMMFDEVKGYATRERAIKQLADKIKDWPQDEKDYVNHFSMIVALPSGRFAPAVRFRTGLVNSLLFENNICLFN